MAKQIFVTQPFLPPLDEFIPYLEEIWANKILTNNGPFHQQLEKELAQFMNVPYISLFANGTLALVTALQVLRITGEVITTPFSFVATTHSLWWNNIKPVFVDIEPEYCTIDPKKIESAITPQTTAILPVHVYGNPCKVEQIKEISETYGLKVIYDAAHTFGVNYKNQSLCSYGDLSVLSFHATKVFNTMEGGAIISHDASTKKRIDYLKNFGFAGETTVMAPGINSKMNEMQAALGLVQLKHINETIEKRKLITEKYSDSLKGIKGITMLPIPSDTLSNYAYLPIFVNKEEYNETRDHLYDRLKLHNIFGRRYFYPLISSFSMYRELPSSKLEGLVNATMIAESILCLPIYPDLDFEVISLIEKILRRKI
ncbi:MAG: DegT/DnrJ/EryC1/StrS family aminotransferase [Bacteroidales bacterium]|nr:DegT/DnrJ/EryC1/StrS family aminotransferase [Bacteroidales bacterium]